MKYFCSHPWQDIDIGQEGKFKPCCRYRNPIADNIHDYLHNGKLDEIKQQFLNGEQPQDCDWCWDEERSGKISKRQYDWEYLFNKTYPDFEQSTYKIISLTFGTTCNLACMTCDSYSSSRWIAEAKRLKEIDKDIVIHEHKKFYKEKEFLDVIRECSKTVSRIDIGGGEPFLTGDEHYRFLSYLVENDIASKIELNYTTNGTIFPKDEIIDLWKSFKKIVIRLSIDGTGPHFEYTRWPAEWSELTNAINKYKNLAQELSNKLELKVMHVVSIFTVYYLPEFTIWCLKNKLDRPYLQILSNPPMYDIRNFPDLVKQAVTLKLEKYNFTEITDYMNAKYVSDDFNKAFTIINFLDQQRSHRFDKTFPEFYQLLKDAGCQI